MAVATRPPVSRERGRSVLRSRSWAACCERAAARDRVTVLIVAAEPMRAALVDRARRDNLEVLAPVTPLDTVQALENHRARIACAIVTSDLPWGGALHQLLSHEYPELERVAFVA